MMTKKQLSSAQKTQLLSSLKERFLSNPNYHKDIAWESVLERLNRDDSKLWALYQMEETGGEPDVVLFNPEDGSYVFYDTSLETPIGRRTLCYDREALDSRKNNKPENSAMDVANEMGVTILDEDEYRFLQTMGQFDQKTSSWILTPSDIRSLKGALFCDRRYNHVFVYHNGADSYYSSRAFRAKVIV